MTPLVSVVIAVYNGEKYLAETLDSLRQQTLTNWECWIVDDGSNDSTPAIINDYMAKDGRFKVIETSGGNGPYIAANMAIPYCLGKYLVRTDADDISIPKRFELQFNYLESSPSIKVCGGRHSAFGPEYPEREIVYCVDQNFIKWQLLFRNRLVHSTLMMELRWFKNLGGYPSKPIAQDFWLWSLAAQKGVLHIIDMPLIKWRIHPESLTNSKRESQLLYASEVSMHNIKKMLDIDVEVRVVESILKARKGISCDSNNDFKRSLELIVNVLKHSEVEKREKVYEENLENIWILIRVNLKRHLATSLYYLFKMLIGCKGVKWIYKKKF